MLCAPALADIYIVLPAPIAVTLKPGERVVSVRAQAVRAFPAQRISIQLALVGSPVFVPTPAPGDMRLVKPGIEDQTPPPLAALHVITQADLDKARDILVDSGVPRKDIKLAIPAAADPKRRIGQVLIAADPATEDNFDRLAQNVSAVTARYPQIVRAGIVLTRDRCDAESIAESAVTRDAGARAAVLANAAGLTSGTQLRNDAWFSDSSIPYQMVCGARVPRITRIEAAVYPGMLANRPYSVPENRAVLFTLTSGRSGRIPRVRFEQPQTDASGLLVAHQFAVPDAQPFVSAQSRFKAIVRPDALIATFYVPPVPFREVPPGLWRDLAGAIQASGLAATEMSRDERTLYVRVPAYEQLLTLEKKTAAVREKYGAYSIGVGAVPVVSDCHAVRAAAAAAAFSAARRRALDMTSAAGVRMGRVFALSDGGERIGALCYRAGAPLGELLDALDTQPPTIAISPSSGAEFSSAVAAAWELQVPPARRSVSLPPPAPPGMYAVYQPFVTHGSGAYGEDKTLTAATRNALEQLHGAQLQAIIDQGGAPEGSPGLEQRVLVVGGS